MIDIIKDLDAYLGGHIPIKELIPENYICPACGISIWDKNQHIAIALPHFENERFIGADYMCAGHSMQTYYSIERPRYMVRSGTGYRVK